MASQASADRCAGLMSDAAEAVVAVDHAGQQSGGFPSSGVLSKTTVYKTGKCRRSPTSLQRYPSTLPPNPSLPRRCSGFSKGDAAQMRPIPNMGSKYNAAEYNSPFAVSTDYTQIVYAEDAGALDG